MHKKKGLKETKEEYSCDCVVEKSKNESGKR
jgi:hypothetical protein